ncbi:unnamed protein product [Spirodela intermedia]|uniref:GIL1/IRKI C-terminal domain-containing protein n=1 Tax=Spirodela intermedia TaxID=51605 RepID=A0A7I8IFS4_SPIIN|nr:unnamed protein product [Spirodela intermedia]CAA6656235.1 unnamed protein product [Spirodela intermedia]
MARQRQLRDEVGGWESHAPAAARDGRYRRRPTPLHHRATPSSSTGSSKATPGKKALSSRDDGGHVVSFTKCRPSAREKISVVPLDNTSGHSRSRSSSAFFSSPRNNGILGSFISSLTWRSPRLSTCTSAAAAPPTKGEDWRLIATELSHKLILATRKRDEAVSEVSRLKHSMSELEKKLTKLEKYCHDLKSKMEFPLEPFLRCICESRAAVRHLSCSLLTHIQQAGTALKAHDVWLPATVKSNLNGAAAGSSSTWRRCLAASSSRTSSQPASSAGAPTAYWTLASGRTPIWRQLQPILRPKNERSSWHGVRRRQRQRGVGRRGWPEPLLQAFFGAAKGVWLVHLLAWCGHPPAAIFRVGAGAPFDAVYMEDAVADRARRPAASSAVRMMVAPGFFVGDSVVKCRVLCGRHRSVNNNIGGNGHASSTVKDVEDVTTASN